MKKYLSIETKLDWKLFVPKIKPNPISLMLRDDKNYSIAWGIQEEIIFTQDQFDYNKLQDFKSLFSSEYIFGYLGYDVKNSTENLLSSDNPDKSGMPDAYFFIPENILFVNNGRITYFGNKELESILKLINSPALITENYNEKISIIADIPEVEYITKVQKIQEEIQNGNIYEMNYCLNFSGTYKTIDDFKVFLKLDEYSKAPFSQFFSFKNGTIISASPERFIKKNKNTLTSQPIKGTAKRDDNPNEDQILKAQLKKDPKELSENVMIVDLVRNDMSKIATKNSVRIEKLFDLISFKTVHQLVSTVSCKLEENVTEIEILKSLFPMGSMTGAPKISAMKIIENSENFKRGIYSGALGYFSPNRNLDFNVVIRSIINNTELKKVNIGVGSAITIQSDPTKEFNECGVKLKAMKRALC